MNPYNYNQQYYGNPMNQPYINPSACMTCNGTGFNRNMSGQTLPCSSCQGHQMAYGGPGMMNPNMGYSGQMGMSQPYYHSGFLDSVKDKFRAITGCHNCRGSGYALSRHGRQTVCPNCISANRYCPKCNNTGYKIKNGKMCNHKF